MIAIMEVAVMVLKRIVASQGNTILWIVMVSYLVGAIRLLRSAA